MLYKCALDINITCNAAKTVCMIFNPKHTKMIIDSDFPNFTLNGVALQFVKQFKYLGHIIYDFWDNDIKPEIRNLLWGVIFWYEDIAKCSVDVELTLFEAYTVCVYMMLVSGCITRPLS